MDAKVPHKAYKNSFPKFEFKNVNKIIYYEKCPKRVPINELEIGLPIIFPKKKIPKTAPQRMHKKYQKWFKDFFKWPKKVISLKIC